MDLESSLLAHTLFSGSSRLSQRTNAVLDLAHRGFETLEPATPARERFAAPLFAPCVLHRFRPSPELSDQVLLDLIGNGLDNVEIAEVDGRLVRIALWPSVSEHARRLLASAGFSNRPPTVPIGVAKSSIQRSIAYLMTATPELSRDVLQNTRAIVVSGGGKILSTSHVALLGLVNVSERLLDDTARLAEVILHEAIHQRLTTLYLTLNLFRPEVRWGTAPHFAPPWHSSNRQVAWPIDQALAALHVYVHLVPLALIEAEALSSDRRLAARNILRARLLARWLSAVGQPFLTTRGRELVIWLQSQIPVIRSLDRHTHEFEVRSLTQFPDGQGDVPTVRCNAQCVPNSAETDSIWRAAYCRAHDDVLVTATTEHNDLLSLRFVLRLVD